MTYILNAVAEGASASAEFVRGSIWAEVDERPVARLCFADRTVTGEHFLIVSDDGTGYRCSDNMTFIPEDVEEPARLQVPEKDWPYFAMLIEDLLRKASRALVVYLEANRIVSRPDPTSEHRVQVGVAGPMSIGDFLLAARDGKIVEECYYEIVNY